MIDISESITGGTCFSCCSTAILSVCFLGLLQALSRWLKQKKEEGYFIVGIEQTSSSTSLADFRFPERPIVLLLGKEREGIPIEFLQLVDHCVEIPQLGLIRSLNVHVTGAITIWEHTKQKLFSVDKTVG